MDALATEREGKIGGKSWMTVNRREVAFSMMGPQNQHSRCRNISKYVHRLATVATLAKVWKTQIRPPSGDGSYARQSVEDT